MDFRLEIVFLPVTDTGRAVEFYGERCGFSVDIDSTVSDELRFVQITPPGSACSIVFGDGIAEDMPLGGDAPRLQLVVDDIDAARAELVAGGVEVSEVETFPYGRFVSFADPDGNVVAVQELPDRGARSG